MFRFKLKSLVTKFGLIIEIVFRIYWNFSPFFFSITWWKRWAVTMRSVFCWYNWPFTNRFLLIYSSSNYYSIQIQCEQAKVELRFIRASTKQKKWRKWNIQIFALHFFVLWLVFLSTSAFVFYSYGKKCVFFMCKKTDFFYLFKMTF